MYLGGGSQLTCPDSRLLVQAGGITKALSTAAFAVRLQSILSTARIHRINIKEAQNAKSEYRFNPKPLSKPLSNS